VATDVTADGFVPDVNEEPIEYALEPQSLSALTLKVYAVPVIVSVLVQVVALMRFWVPVWAAPAASV
jgi:hypothetical protein